MKNFEEWLDELNEEYFSTTFNLSNVPEELERAKETYYDLFKEMENPILESPEFKKLGVAFSSVMAEGMPKSIALIKGINKTLDNGQTLKEFRFNADFVLDRTADAYRFKLIKSQSPQSLTTTVAYSYRLSEPEKDSWKITKKSGNFGKKSEKIDDVSLAQLLDIPMDKVFEKDYIYNLAQTELSDEEGVGDISLYLKPIYLGIKSKESRKNKLVNSLIFKPNGKVAIAEIEDFYNGKIKRMSHDVEIMIVKAVKDMNKPTKKISIDVANPLSLSLTDMDKNPESSELSDDSDIVFEF